jgi:hypothetical protein
MNRCWNCGHSYVGTEGPFCEPCVAAAAAGPVCSCGQPAVTRVQDAFGGFAICQDCASESDLSWAAEHGASRSVA